MRSDFAARPRANYTLVKKNQTLKLVCRPLIEEICTGEASS